MGDGLDEVKKRLLCGKKVSWFLLRHWNVPDIWRKPSEHLMRWDILWRKSWFLIWIIQEKRILIVQQQVMAGSIREELRKRGADGELTVASWFSMEKISWRRAMCH